MFYEDLYLRLYYFEEVKQYIEIVIIEKKFFKGMLNIVFVYLCQCSMGSVKSVIEELFYFVMLLLELNSYLNIINLQIEVINFMYQCVVERGGFGFLWVSEGSCFFILFGNGYVRGDMVVQVNVVFFD